MDRMKSIVPQSQALQILNPYLQTIVDIHEQAMRAFVNDGKQLIYKLSNGCKSTIIHDLIVDEAKSRLPFGNGCKQDTIDGLFVVIVEEVLILRFKKLGNDLTTSNQPSWQVKKFNSQRSIFDGKQMSFFFLKDDPIIKPDAVNINIGYIPNQTLTGIHALYATAPQNEKKNLWDWLFYIDGILLPYETEEIPVASSPKGQKRYSVDISHHLKKDDADEEEN